MNPTADVAPEPVVSVPLGVVLIGLLLFAGALVLVIWLRAQRYRSAPTLAKAVSMPEEVPWLASLLEGLSQPALVLGTREELVALNTAAERALGQNDSALELPAPLHALVKRVLAADTPETTDIATSDGPRHRLRVTASPLGDKLGALVLFHSPIQGGRSAESYRSLISAVTHELRTPLTAILGHAEILGSCNPVKDEALWRRSRDFIGREAQRLARLVEDLSTLSRFDRTPLQRQPVNLRAVAEEAISALYQDAEARGVGLSLHSPPSIRRVWGDRDRLGQVLINLLDNAIKYSPSGSQADVHLIPEGEFVAVEVRDTGVGIPPEELPFIFDSLFRGDGVRATPGTGLGLTIVRTILDQHGATIDIHSVPKQGTVVCFRLPCAHSDLTDIAQIQPTTNQI
jgi:two-component system phosphate regulon sensor histidine kinase PhoR